VLPNQFSIHRKSKSDAGKGLISFLFPIRYNLLKNKEIAMGKRLITPLFHFKAADQNGKFPIYLWRVFHRKMAIPSFTVCQNTPPKKYQVLA